MMIDYIDELELNLNLRPEWRKGFKTFILDKKYQSEEIDVFYEYVVENEFDFNTDFAVELEFIGDEYGNLISLACGYEEAIQEYKGWRRKEKIEGILSKL